MKILKIYQGLSWAALPIVPLFFGYRIIKGKEEKRRLKERLGFGGCPRPEGRLIWMHGASVGECLSMLPLIHRILAEDKTVHIMVTSGTKTSAELMKKRLPERAFHHFIPLDTPVCCGRFLRHFRPSCVLWFESDFWPNMLAAIHRRKIPLGLINGRISDKSFRRWQGAKWFIRPILNLFTFLCGQTALDAQRLEVLSAQKTYALGNLKFAAPLPPFDKQELQDFYTAIGTRPVWSALSTHGGEEEMILKIHDALKKTWPNLLTILGPRHPNRAGEIMALIKKHHLTGARRSLKQVITPKTDVYVADTIGEYGLFYQLAPIVFIGGSLIPFGGQNMLEPMRFSRGVVIGPHAFNFKEIVALGTKAGALTVVPDAGALQEQVAFWLANAKDLKTIQQKAGAFASQEADVLERVYQLLKEKEFV